jgi:hypothetical protein
VLAVGLFALIVTEIGGNSEVIAWVAVVATIVDDGGVSYYWNSRCL